VVPKGVINVANGTVDPVPEPIFSRKYCFVLTSNTGERVVLQAASESDRAVWLERLQRVSSQSLFIRGTLLKRMKHRNKWKERYFLLNGAMLRWFEKEDGKMKG
jgi:hypothetical protein